MLRLIFVFLLFLGSNSFAADISKLPTKSGDTDFILIKGEIKENDDKIFRNIALETDSAIVILDSPGGFIAPALEIGKTIRIKSFATAVIDSNCVSACALTWLAGQPRMLNKNSGVGFHGAYEVNNDGTKSSTSIGNALVGSYLNSLGLNEDVVTLATAAKPDKLIWLSKKMADEIGLPVSILDNKTKAITNFNRAVNLRWDKSNPQIKEALKFYILSADDGFAGAQNNLGDMYEFGNAVEKNDKMAVYWYTRSAERGEPTAYLSLSTILSDSVDENILVEALKFAYLASLKLPDGANKNLAKRTIKKITPKLSKSSKDKAFALAKSWEPLYQEKNLMSDKPNR